MSDNYGSGYSGSTRMDHLKKENSSLHFMNQQHELQLQTISVQETKHNLDSTQHLPMEFLNQSLAEESRQEWVSSFNTSLLTTRANEIKDQSTTIAEILRTPEFECLILAAKCLSEREGIPSDVATERLIETFRKMDRAWSQMVLKRGLETLISGGE